MTAMTPTLFGVALITVKLATPVFEGAVVVFWHASTARSVTRKKSTTTSFLNIDIIFGLSSN
jgi:hypothetical protein